MRSTTTYRHYPPFIPASSSSTGSRKLLRSSFYHAEAVFQGFSRPVQEVTATISTNVPSRLSASFDISSKSAPTTTRSKYPVLTLVLVVPRARVPHVILHLPEQGNFPMPKQGPFVQCFLILFPLLLFNRASRPAAFSVVIFTRS